MKNFYISIYLMLIAASGFAQWTALTSGTTNHLRSVYFADANIGYAVGINGTILKTNNGGANWIAQISGTTNHLNSVYFINANTGYAVGDSATILKTSNGGVNWTAQTSEIISNLTSVCFANSSSGYAVGSNGSIIETVDGVTWSSNLLGGYYPVSVYFADAITGYAVGSCILKTTDGGNYWLVQSTSQGGNSVYFTNVNTGWVVDSSGTILKTNNGGTNWTVQTSGTHNNLLSVYFVDSNTGYTVGDSGTILKSSNGGINWTFQTSGTINSLRSVYFTGADTGYAVGSNGTILKTTNGGTGISELYNKKDNITLYPNPATNQITLQFKSGEIKSFEILLYNEMGQAIFKQDFFNTQNTFENTFNIKNYPAGIYFILIKAGESILSSKFIKL